LQMQGMSSEQFFQMSGQTEEQLREQMKEDAGKRVKTNLTLETIVNTEELEASEEDIDKEIDKMAEMYSMEKEQIVGMLGGNTDMLKEDLKMQKAIDFLVENSKTV